MDSYYKALIAALALAALVFALSRGALGPDLAPPRDLAWRKRLWILLTVLVFIVPNFWAFVAITSAIVWTARRTQSNRVALLGFLLLTIPELKESIPGFGGVNFLFQLSTPRLLLLLLFVPASVALPKLPRRGLCKFADILVAGFVLYTWFIAIAPQDTLTNILRIGFLRWLDIWLPYYVASRCVADAAAVRELFASMLLAGCVLGAIAIFESLRHWLLFEAVERHLGLSPGFQIPYLARFAGGPLRARTTAGHPIALGFYFVFLLPMFLAIAPQMKGMGSRVGALLLQSAGLIFSFSRGPWISALLSSLTYVIRGTRLTKAMARVAIMALLIGFALYLTPVGNLVLPYLPFVGQKAQEGTVDYRVQLFDTALTVVNQHPLFGDVNYMQNPLMERMRQGEGIIDVVNSYLGIAMEYGLVGLTLFAVIALLALLRSWRGTKVEGKVATELNRLHAAHLGALTGVLAAIAAVSQILAIPYFMWLLIGLCLGNWCVAPPGAQRAGAATPPRSR